MSKSKIVATILLVISVILIGYGVKMDFFDKGIEKENNFVEGGNIIQEESISDKVESALKNMTLDEKIGQLIIISYRKESMDDTLKSELKDVSPGGFILFSENITTYDNTIKLIKDIKGSSSLPMFISIDEEGGSVQRLNSLKDIAVSNIPYMYDLGQMEDLALTKEVAKVVAEELRVFGINMDFAPDIDVWSNKENTVIGKRSFGENPSVVSAHGLAFGSELEKNNIIPVYKHFPGLGSTVVDSHFDLPIINLTKEELLNSDLIPFISVIKTGAPIIMVGHLAVPNITGDNTPASLSKVIITNLLKEELGYNGLVITDALNMEAITKYYTEEEICSKVVEAGADILLMPSNSRTCINSIKNSIENGIFDEERINESVRKILTLKYEKIDEVYDTYLSSDYLNSVEHKNIIDKVIVSE